MGMIASKMDIPYVVNVTGLGTSIVNKNLKQGLILKGYKNALKKANCVYFQNKANKNFFVDRNVTFLKNRLIPGSGVNISDNSFESYPKNKEAIHFLYVGRIMQDKGIHELLLAAEIIKKRYKNMHFSLIGFCEDNFEKVLKPFVEKKIVNYLGSQDNVHCYLKETHVLIQPSYHEGMSNSLLEAAACGRPVLASNIPGCQEAFDEGITGFGFEPRNVDDLVRAIEKFIALPYEQKQVMGIAGRKKMEREFDRQIVVDAYMEEIKNILKNKKENNH